MSKPYAFQEHIRAYQDSLRDMSDNRLLVEWNLVQNQPNKYSGKPVRFKLCAIQEEARTRKYFSK